MKKFLTISLLFFSCGCAMRQAHPRTPVLTPLPFLYQQKTAVFVSYGGWNNSLQPLLEDMLRGRGATIVALPPYFQWNGGWYGSGTSIAQIPAGLDFLVEARAEERNCGYYYYSRCVVVMLRVVSKNGTIVATGVGQYRSHRGPYVVYGGYYDDQYTAYAWAARAAVDDLH